MSETLVLKVATHAGLEALGGAGMACLLLLCDHDHFGHRLAFLNRLVRSRAYRLSVTAFFYLATSAAAVVLIDGEILREGLAVFALSVGLHLALEAVGGASLVTLLSRERPSALLRSGPGASPGVRWDARRALLLGAWYLAFSLLTVSLIPLGHGG